LNHEGTKNTKAPGPTRGFGKLPLFRVFRVFRG
jgi:hypothetical protein